MIIAFVVIYLLGLLATTGMLVYSFVTKIKKPGLKNLKNFLFFLRDNFQFVFWWPWYLPTIARGSFVVGMWYINDIRRSM